MIPGGFSEIFIPDNKVMERLEVAVRNNPRLIKTQLQMASKLRWDLFEKYWNWMIQARYIERREDNIYTITPRGNELFTLFHNFRDMIKC